MTRKSCSFLDPSKESSPRVRAREAGVTRCPSPDRNRVIGLLISRLQMTAGFDPEYPAADGSPGLMMQQNPASSSICGTLARGRRQRSMRTSTYCWSCTRKDLGESHAVRDRPVHHGVADAHSCLLTRTPRPIRSRTCRARHDAADAGRRIGSESPARKPGASVSIGRRGGRRRSLSRWP